jgi:hypothetical protein
MMLLPLIAGLLRVEAAAIKRVSPMAKVVELLNNLQTQCQEEGSEEAATYDTFACFCKDTTESKVTSIKTYEDNIQADSADEAQLSASVDQLKAEVAKLNTDIDTMEMELKKATELREQEHADYVVAYADATKAVDSLERAITAIEGSKLDLKQVQSIIRPVLLMADAMSILPSSSEAPKKAVASLLEEGPDGQPDYEFHAGDILGTLGELKTSFGQKKSDLQSEEEAAASAFETASDAKRDEITSGKETLATKEGLLSDDSASLAEVQGEISEATALLHDDRQYLKDLTEQCERKANEWDQRSGMRKQELAAISQALEILSTASAKAEETGAGGRAEPVGALQMEIVDDLDDSNWASFVQKNVRKASESSSALEESLKPRNRIIALLKASAHDLKSTDLTFLAMKIAEDPFAKVKVLIQQLIQRLLAESKNEATHKGWCDTELGKASHSRDSRHQDVTTLTADIEELEARKAKLLVEKDELNAQILELTSALTNATNDRADEKADHDATMKSAQEGLTALKAAITTLKDFYKMGAKAFAQGAKASPVDEDSPGAGFDGSYQGNQAQGQGIIGMLETIQSDFERTLSQTDAAETQSYRDFVAFSKETKASKASKETGLTNCEADLVQTSADLSTRLLDLQQNQQLLDTALKALEALRPACIDTGMSFEERTQRREAEISALKGALCTLDDSEADCTPSFLQRK